MEGKKRDFVIRNPKLAWQAIRQLILDDEDMTVEELDEELKAYGVDPDDTVKKLFEIAQRVSRESQSGGRVSPHVSDILTQLAPKYYGLESAGDKDSKTAVRRERSTPRNIRTTGAQDKPTRARVLSYHRNYKDESENDRKIREGNEDRLREKAEKLKQKRIGRKK